MEISVQLPWASRNGLLISFIVSCFFSASSQTTSGREEEMQYYRDSGIQPLINSEQEGDFAPGTYLIPHDILIPKGKVMTVFPGTRILFTQNAMLVVNGTLICSGSVEAPVVFRKLDNRSYFLQIDPRVETRWDGIYLPDSAKLKMSNTIISDSKYGIVISGKDVTMSFDSVSFINNKFQNVKIGDRMMKITENTPVIFHYPEQQGVFIEPVVVQNATETIQQGRHHGTAYPQLRVGMGLAAGAGLIAGGMGIYMYKYKEQYDAGRILAIGGAILFGVGAVGFTWTFIF